MVQKCLEIGVTVRLTEGNQWGVGFGFRSSNCTKTRVSYPLPPPPNIPLNSLQFSIEPLYHFPPLLITLTILTLTRPTSPISHKQNSQKINKKFMQFSQNYDIIILNFLKISLYY